MRIYYNRFSSVFRYYFCGNIEAIGQISLTPEPILLSSGICYYIDLEEGILFSGNFQNPKVYKEYNWEICDKYKDSYQGEGYDSKTKKNILYLKDGTEVPMPDDLYTSRKVYLSGKLIKEDIYYHNAKCPKGFYETDERINYYKTPTADS